jgi:hypothetical protein
MDATRSTHMKNGLLSLLTVVIVISLATAAVLAVSTSHAMKALADRQAMMTGEGYAAEKSAQTFVAMLDEEITDAAENSENVLKRVNKHANELLVDAVQEGVSATYNMVDDELTCTFTTTNGRMLETRLTIGNEGTYEIKSWKLMAAPEDVETSDLLWTGSATNE